MTSSGKLIHREKFFRINNLIPLFFLAAGWIIFLIIGKDTGPLIFWSVFLIIAIIVSSRRNSTYVIYEDRIELFNSFTNELSAVVMLDQINQVRYEDGFNEMFFWSDFIIVYPQKSEQTKNLRNNRISLSVTGYKRRAIILDLLKFFQSKNLEVVVKTTSKKILRETGLTNWDQA